jgi:hypothetical protein
MAMLFSPSLPPPPHHTDKKENKMLLTCKEIQKRVVAKSYMANGLLIYDYIFYYFLIRKPFLLNDFATAPI